MAMVGQRKMLKWSKEDMVLKANLFAREVQVLTAKLSMLLKPNLLARELKKAKLLKANLLARELHLYLEALEVKLKLEA